MNWVLATVQLDGRLHMEQQQASVTKEAAVKSSNSNAARQQPVQEFACHGTPFQLLQRLHATAGNRAAGHWIQAKLKVGAPNDLYEQEADRVADQIMSASDNLTTALRSVDLGRRTSSNHLQRQSLAGDSAGIYDEETGQGAVTLMHPQESNDLGLQSTPVTEESLQTKCSCQEEEGDLQRKPALSLPGVTVPSNIVQR